MKLRILHNLPSAAVSAVVFFKWLTVMKQHPQLRKFFQEFAQAQEKKPHKINQAYIKIERD